MMAAHHHPVERPMIVNDQSHQKPDARKRNQEGCRSDKHPPPRPVRNRRPHQEAQSRELQKHQQHNDNQARECKQDQRSASGN